MHLFTPLGTDLQLCQVEAKTEKAGKSGHFVHLFPPFPHLGVTRRVVQVVGDGGEA